MRKFLAMIKKELKEMVRNYKIITVPIVFMILGALQPLTYYYLPDILKMATLPEGAILEIPTPTTFETMTGVFGQFTQMGLLILVLISMGAVANEVKNGVTETILVKPVAVKYYLLSKWAAYFGITILGTLLGVLIGYFYTVELIGEISGIVVFNSTLVYILYLLFIMSITLLLSTVLDSSIVAGGITIAFAIGISLISYLPIDTWWLPSYLLKLNQNILYQIPSEHFWPGIITSMIYIVISIFTGIILFKRKFVRF